LLELLRLSRYRWLLSSNVAFFLAMQSQALVRGFLAFKLTGSEFALGGVSLAVAVPMLLVSPIGGVLADRVDRRLVIAAAQALVLVSESVTLVLYVTGRLQFWHLVAAALVIGSVLPLIMPARQSIVANVVDRERLPSAIALNLTGMNVARVAGPALGGVLIVGDDVRLAYGAAIAIYLGALLCLLKLGPALPPATAGVSRWASLLEGFRYLAQNRLVGLLLLFGLVPLFLAMPFQSLLPAFADKVWTVGPGGLGMLSAAVGLGGVAGSLFIVWRVDLRRRLALQLASMLGFGVLLVAFCWAPRFPVALALVFVSSACASVFGTVNSTTIQVLIPDEVRGRVSSFLMMSYSLPLLGVLPVSYAAEHLGVQWAVSGAALLAAALGVGFVAGSPTLRGVDAAVSGARGRTGPASEPRSPTSRVRRDPGSP
jgi:predicted MFS family arabinose efflux permease